MKQTLGVDVAKRTLVCFLSERVSRIENEKKAILWFLKSLKPDQVRIGLESTGIYGELFAHLAFVQGFDVYYLNPTDVKHYKDAVAPRAKTDRLDAQVIARYVDKEHESLRLYRDLPEAVRKIKKLLSRRGKLAQMQQALISSFADVKEFSKEKKALIKQLKALMDKMEAQIKKEASGLRNYNLVLGIPGIGPLTAASLVAILEGGDFTGDEAFIAFLGLDLRARDSGEMRGRRRLSKRGDPEPRRLLYNAAMAAVRHSAVWKAIFEEYLARGMSRTQAYVAIMRRLASAAWSIHRHGTVYDPERVRKQATRVRVDPVDGTPTLDEGAVEEREQIEMGDEKTLPYLPPAAPVAAKKAKAHLKDVAGASLQPPVSTVSEARRGSQRQQPQQQPATRAPGMLSNPQPRAT